MLIECEFSHKHLFDIFKGEAVETIDPGRRYDPDRPLSPDEIDGVTISVHQLAIGALIRSHPEPDKFADHLERMIGYSQVQWAQRGLARPKAKELALETAAELVEFARQEADIRRQGKKEGPL